MTELAREYAVDYKKDPSNVGHLRREVEMLLSAIREKIAAGIEMHDGETVETYCGKFATLLKAMDG